MNKSPLLIEWETARDDLKIEITAPYEVDLGNGRIVKADVLVKHFGGKNGTLVFTDSDKFWTHHDQLSKLNYGTSVLDDPSEPYNRDAMIDMLSEWGWTGDDTNKPEWVVDPENDDE